MLEKFLPSFQKKKNDQKQKLQNQKNPQSPQKSQEQLNLQNPGSPRQEKQEAQEKKKNEKEENLAPGFNLISQFQNFYVVPKYAEKIISLIRKFIVIVSVVFGVLLIFNFVVSYVIQFQKSWQEELVREIDSYAGVEEKAKRISDKTFLYKKFSNDRKLLSEKLNYVLDNVGSDVTLEDVQMDHLGFALSLSGKSALDFTNLIVRYLEGDMLSEIVIVSANFDKSENDFNVKIDGVFK